MKLLALAAFAVLSSQQPVPAPAPTPAAQEKSAKADKPLVYNEAADAKADIAAALARASDNNRRVLLQWGANWCGWCVKLHDLYGKDKAISRELLYEYDVVYVDIGTFDRTSGGWTKNSDIGASYGVDMKAGVPFLTVLDAKGKVLANQDTGALEIPKGAEHDPAKVLEFLKKYQPEYLNANELLAAAQAQALGEKKRVFLTFDAPWCGWCHKLENWMDTPQAKALLAKDFVIRKIDIDRTIGGKELKAKYCATESGIPWFCVLDADGKSLGNSMFEAKDKNGVAVQQNTGFPSTDEEIMAFATLLGKVARNLTAEDIDKLQRSLVEVRENDKKKQKAS